MMSGEIRTGKEKKVATPSKIAYERLEHVVKKPGIEASTPEMENIHVVCPLPDGGLLLYTTVHSHEVKHYIIRITNDAVKTLYTIDKGAPITTFLLLQNGDVLVLQRNGIITKVRVSDGKQLEQFKVDVGRLHDGLIMDQDHLLLVDSDRGEIFTYRMISVMMKKRKNVIMKKLAYPTSLLRTVIDGEMLYIMCEGAAHTVRVYDAEWKLQRSIGREGPGDGQFNRPQSAILLPGNTVLVSDSWNNRVTEFTLSGRFIRHLLQSNDGIEGPERLCFHFPYLWVKNQPLPGPCSPKPNVKCFQLYTKVLSE